MKYITEQINLSGNFKFLGKSTRKLFRFKIKYLGYLDFFYKAAELVHNEQQFQLNYGMGIDSTPYTTISTESTEYIEILHLQNKDDQGYESNGATLIACHLNVSNFYARRRLICGK